MERRVSLAWMVMFALAIAVGIGWGLGSMPLVLYFEPVAKPGVLGTGYTPFEYLLLLPLMIAWYIIPSLPDVGLVIYLAPVVIGGLLGLSGVLIAWMASRVYMSRKRTFDPSSQSSKNRCTGLPRQDHE